MLFVAYFALIALIVWLRPPCGRYRQCVYPIPIRTDKDRKAVNASVGGARAEPEGSVLPVPDEGSVTEVQTEELGGHVADRYLDCPAARRQ